MKKNWKTTTFGALTAAGLGLSQMDDPVMKAAGQVMAILGPVLLGVFAKDSNVTGGTVQQ